MNPDALMKSLLSAFCIACTCGVLHAQTNAWQPTPGHTQIPLWPGTVPDARVQPPLKLAEFVTNIPTDGGKHQVVVCNNVTRPTITVYSPRGTNTGVAMVVCPGGGYQVLAMDIEGTEICDWLNSRGITAVLLKYRVPVTRVGDYGESPLALEDAQRALSLVRFHAAEWHIDAHKIGVIGFSAGGHLVAATSTHFDKRSYRTVDSADKVSCRPDFALAIYPGHLWERDNGLKLNPNVPVTTNTPPTFIVMAEDDHVDYFEQAVVYYLGLKQAGVPVEMHLYASGGHAFGLRHPELRLGEWPELAEKWLGSIGMVSR